jgi:hypothetical protein
MNGYREDHAPAWDGRIIVRLAAATDSTRSASLAEPFIACLTRSKPQDAAFPA